MDHKFQKAANKALKQGLDNEKKQLLVMQMPGFTVNYVRQLKKFVEPFSIAEAPLLIAALRVVTDMVRKATENSCDFLGNSLTDFMSCMDDLYEFVSANVVSDSISLIRPANNQHRKD